MTIVKYAKEVIHVIYLINSQVMGGLFLTKAFPDEGRVNKLTIRGCFLYKNGENIIKVYIATVSAFIIVHMKAVKFKHVNIIGPY